MIKRLFVSQFIKLAAQNIIFDVRVAARRFYFGMSQSRLNSKFSSA